MQQRFLLQRPPGGYRRCSPQIGGGPGTDLLLHLKARGAPGQGTGYSHPARGRGPLFRSRDGLVCTRAPCARLRTAGAATSVKVVADVVVKKLPARWNEVD